ncbi:MAG: hypothetical protein WCS32_02955 [Candidatus Izemoplasmatales bacterium]
MKLCDVHYKALMIDDTEIVGDSPLNIETIKTLLKHRGYSVDIDFHQFKNVGRLTEYLKHNDDYDLILFDVILEMRNGNEDFNALSDSLSSYKEKNRLTKTILFTSLVEEHSLKGPDIRVSGSLILNWINHYRINGLCARDDKVIAELISRCIEEIDPITMNLISILDSYQNHKQKFIIGGSSFSTRELIHHIRAQSDVGKEFVAGLTRMMIARYTEPTD